MRKTLIIILLLVFVGTTLFAAPFSNVPKGMKQEVNSLMQFSETRDFLNQLEREGGPITLNWVPMGERHFQAFWWGGKRLIGLNASKKWTKSEKIFSILFESHNASTDKQFNHLDALAKKKKITRQAYIESVERIEYQNIVNATNLFKRGASLGYFPSNPLPQYNDWPTHLRTQMAAGHSGFIGKKYDSLVNTA